MEDFGLITTIALALGLALVGGLSARAIGLSPIVGYLAAGLILSPFTPGYDADTEELRELAELGVIFLMFGVGLHFNIADLLRVKNIAITGALVLIAAATAMGIAVSLAFGLELEEGIVVGLAVRGSSPVGRVKALEEFFCTGKGEGRASLLGKSIKDARPDLDTLATEAQGRFLKLLQERKGLLAVT
ncbi:MAG: cation:proton antiporter, partial [Dehalococcoidia bacterium]